MPIILNDNIQSNSPKSLDNKYLKDGVTPYVDVADVNTTIPLTYRSIGLKVNIANVDYWYKDGVADIDLIPFGSGSDSFINPNPMPVTVGGFPSGNTFPTAQTMQQMWDGLLYPYQNPAFSSISNALFANYEVGQNLPSGLINISYAVSNSANIKTPQPPNVGVPSSSIIGATFPINPFQLLASGTFGINIPALTTSNVPASFSVSCQGTNTNNVTFSGSNSLSFFFRNYWGFNANASLLAVDILNLQSSQLKSGFSGNYIMPSNATPRYLWFAYPDSFGYPTTIFDVTNGFNATSDFINAGTIIAPNQFGVSITWRLIRSVNQTAGAGGFNYLFS